MRTYGDLFSGFGGSSIGAMQAGLTPIWAIEKSSAVADVARANLGDHVIVADVLDVDPSNLPRPDVLHASPPCPSFSIANSKAAEQQADIDMALATACFICKLQPRVFTLENVPPYRHAVLFGIVVGALAEMGYFYDWDILNAADFGVPQTRRRLFLRAVHGALLPPLPPPEPWIGWLEAIEDLLPTLPESQFAPWQLARLPDEFRTMLLPGGGNTNLASARPGRGCRLSDEPAHTVVTVTQEGGAMPRALLVDSAGYTGNDGVTVLVTREQDEPANTIYGRRPMRAFLLGGQFGRPADSSGECRPAQNRYGIEPCPTVTAVNKGDWRGFIGNGRVVKMTTRCLARFQSFPDDYRLPDNQSLACYGIGNAVPPFLYRKLLEGLLD